MFSRCFYVYHSRDSNVFPAPNVTLWETYPLSVISLFCNGKWLKGLTRKSVIRCTLHLCRLVTTCKQTTLAMAALQLYCERPAITLRVLHYCILPNYCGIAPSPPLRSPQLLQDRFMLLYPPCGVR